MKNMISLCAVLLTLSATAHADGLYQDNYKSPNEAVDGHSPTIQMTPPSPPETLPEQTSPDANSQNNTQQDNGMGGNSGMPSQNQMNQQGQQGQF